MMVTSEHKQLVMSKLLRMEYGQIKIVSDPMDVLTIHRIIDYGTDVANGFSVTWNSAGNKIRKDQYVK